MAYKESYHDPQWLIDYVSEYIKPLSLNLCCGKSKLCDIKADINLKVKPDILCDMYNLPFKRGSFNSIYCDPEWHTIHHTKRYKLMFMIRDLLKKNGLLIWNSHWAFDKLVGFETVKIHYEHMRWHGTVIMTCIYRKINAQLDEWIEG